MKNNRGIALVELLIVIGVIGLITAGIVALSTSVFTGLNEKAVIDKANSIKATVQKAYTNQGNYKGVSKDSPILSSVDIINPFTSEPIEISSVNNDKVAYIEFFDISTDSCINILTSFSPTAFDYVLVTDAALTVDSLDALDTKLTYEGVEEYDGSGDSMWLVDELAGANVCAKSSKVNIGIGF